MPRVPSTRGKSICNCSETRRAQEAQGSDPRRDSGGARQGRGAACRSASSTCCTTSAPNSPMHSFGPLTEPSPTASALRPSHVTDSLTFSAVGSRAPSLACGGRTAERRAAPRESADRVHRDDALNAFPERRPCRRTESVFHTSHAGCDSLERHHQRS